MGKNAGGRFAKSAGAMHDYLRRSGEALARRRKPPPLKAAEAAFNDCADIVAETKKWEKVIEDAKIEKVQ